MFKKKSLAETPRQRRPTQQPATRSTVFSYHAQRTPRPNAPGRDISQQDVTQRTKPRRNWAKAAPNIVIAIGVGVLVFFSLQLTGAPKIELMNNASNQVFLRDKAIYEDAAASAFARIGDRNKITINTDRIAHDLMKQFPEIEHASVSLPFIGTRPTVYLQPAAPKLILAGSDSGSGIYIVDSAGRALIAGNQVHQLQRLSIPVVSDQSGLALRVGDVALPRSTVAFIYEVAYQLKEKNVKTTSLTLPPGTNELHIRFEGVGYYAKFNMYGNAREQSGAYIALKKRLESERKTPAEYVDVRVEGRVYYK